MSFKQAEHKLLMIPGPIEVADDVLYANAHPAMAHVSPDFVPVFGKVLTMLKKVLYAPNSQPFVVAGCGTLGWDMVSTSVVQPSCVTSFPSSSSTIPLSVAGRIV